MNVLRELDESLFLAVTGQGYPVSHLHVRSSWGWNLASLPATDRGKPSFPTLLSSRQALWRSLREKVSHHAIVPKTVAKVAGGDRRRPQVFFTDAYPPVEADLVIGADGVRSVAKKCVLQEHDEKEFSNTYV